MFTDFDAISWIDALKVQLKMYFGRKKSISISKFWLEV